MSGRPQDFRNRRSQGLKDIHEAREKAEAERRRAFDRFKGHRDNKTYDPARTDPLQRLLYEQRIEIDVSVRNHGAIALSQRLGWAQNTSVGWVPDHGVIKRFGTVQLQRVGPVDQSVQFNAGRFDFGVKQICQQGLRKPSKALVDFNAMQRLVDGLKDGFCSCAALASLYGDAGSQWN
jgi:hypothetical protein